MGDKPWKQFERHAASLFDGKRHWANSGERVDFESEYAIGQCKLVQCLSLEGVTKLCEEMEEAGRAKEKVGVVVTKVRRGSGKSSPTIISMTENMLNYYVAVTIYRAIAKMEDAKHAKNSTSDRPSDQPAQVSGS